MTSYSRMSADGRAESRARTAGRRKVTAERIEYGVSNVVGIDGEPPAWTTVPGYLIGSCGHRLRWLAAVSVHNGEPRPSRYLTEKLGRKVTCPHDDCRIPEHVYTDADCEYVMGSEVERRCTTRARWDTNMGKVCTRHRNHYEREGYLDGPGEPIK